jgi:hypothetical protein
LQQSYAAAQLWLNQGVDRGLELPQFSANLLMLRDVTRFINSTAALHGWRVGGSELEAR